MNSAVAAFTKALADLGKTDGVQVNCIHPSYVDTERFARRVKADMERTGKSEAEVREWHRKDIGITRLGTTDDVAGLIAFMVSAARPLAARRHHLARRRRGADAVTISAVTGDGRDGTTQERMNGATHRREMEQRECPLQPR